MVRWRGWKRSLMRVEVEVGVGVELRHWRCGVGECRHGAAGGGGRGRGRGVVEMGVDPRMAPDALRAKRKLGKGEGGRDGDKTHKAHVSSAPSARHGGEAGTNADRAEGLSQPHVLAQEAVL